VSDDGKGYNTCHFWTSEFFLGRKGARGTLPTNMFLFVPDFEIIDLSFVRSPAYTSYFKSLDMAGGFFYERWGDAPVRSIAASMMLDRSEIWHVDFAGYVSAVAGLRCSSASGEPLP
jgi:alpha 1,2-mannosyltransferase